MAVFKYRMQNILDIKEKLESQEKIAYSQANAVLMEEQQKLQEFMARKTGYERQLKEAEEGLLDIARIRICKQAIDAMKSMIRTQMMNVHVAQKNVEIARARLNNVMQERKTHENLKEKAFEVFKEELAVEESKITDGLVSYTYHNKEEDAE